MSERSAGSRSSKASSRKSMGVKGDSNSQTPPGNSAKIEPSPSPMAFDFSTGLNLGNPVSNQSNYQDSSDPMSNQPRTDGTLNLQGTKPSDGPSDGFPLLQLGLVGQPLPAPKDWAKRLEAIRSPFVGSYSHNAPEISKFVQGNEYADRIEDGLTLGEEYYKGTLLRISRSRHPTRSETRSIFREEYEMLNDFLTNVYQCPTAEGNGYCIDRTKLLQLNTRWMQLKNTYDDELIMTGLSSAVPRWGPYGSATDLWNANDFEVLAICYRHEVESFFSRILDARRDYDAILSNVGDTTQFGVKQESLRGETNEIKGSPRLRTPLDLKPPRSLTNTPRDEGSTRHIALGTPSSMREDVRLPNDADEFSGKRPRISYELDPRGNNAAPPNFRTRMMSEVPFFRGAPAQTSSSRKFQELFGTTSKDYQSNPVSKNPFSNYRNDPNRLDFDAAQRSFNSYEEERLDGSTGAGRNDGYSLPDANRFGGRNRGGDPDDGGSSSSDEKERIRGPYRDEPRNPFRRTRREGREFHRRPDFEERSVQPIRTVPEAQFDTKLKVDIIPSWDGSLDTLVRWITKVNRLSAKSRTVHKQLGNLVPGRFTGSAETWYFSLPLRTREEYEQDWTTLRTGIAGYYMNRSFIEKQKRRANRAYYRQNGHTRETPSEYFIRKVELLEFSYDYSDSEMITEVMNGAPTVWTSILTPHLFSKLVDFQHTLRFHEDHLLTLNARVTRYDEPQPWNKDSHSRNPFESFKSARTNLIGASSKLPTPPFPKDDTNVSKRKTPESLGVRPCRHCGSAKHWDNECKYSRRAQKVARANLATVDEEDDAANQDYDDAYFGMDSEDEGDQTGF